MVLTMPWELPSDLPWSVLTNPLDKWSVQPSFVVAEYAFIAVAAIALWHARKHGRAHLLVWVAAIIAGTANDLIFMALPIVNNFWQAQATIMLTPRLPLYIPCVYVCFMYLPTVAVWRMGLGPLPRAALTGLVAILFYAPYDIVGAKFLWWTWHDTDMPISNRLLGVPIGSTVWVITFVATFAWLIGRQVDRDPEISRRTFVRATALVAALCSVVMVVQLTVLQQLDGGVPGIRGLFVVVIGYGAIALRGLRSGAPLAPILSDRVVLGAILGHYLMLATVVSVFDPDTHESASLHQTYGACHVEARDIAGLIRYEFVCAEDYDEDFSFCKGTPAAGADWYTVCGRPHRNKAQWVLAVMVLGLVGGLVFGVLFGPLRPRRLLPHGTTIGQQSDRP